MYLLNMIWIEIDKIRMRLFSWLLSKFILPSLFFNIFVFIFLFVNLIFLWNLDPRSCDTDWSSCWRVDSGRGHGQGQYCYEGIFRQWKGNKVRDVLFLYVFLHNFFVRFFPTDNYCLFLIFPSFLIFREKGSISQLKVILLLMWLIH